MARVEAIRGDLTRQSVDAIVNAANRGLLGGGGVDGAIHRAGGPAILLACEELRRTTLRDGLPTGRAVATTAGNLPARWVIHTVGPIYANDEDAPGLLASCHVESLRVADALGARSIAFPAISTGAFGYPIELAAPVAVEAVLGAETAVEEIRFVLLDGRALEIFQRALDRRSS